MVQLAHTPKVEGAERGLIPQVLRIVWADHNLSSKMSVGIFFPHITLKVLAYRLLYVL